MAERAETNRSRRNEGVQKDLEDLIHQSTLVQAGEKKGYTFFLGAKMSRNLDERVKGGKVVSSPSAIKPSFPILKCDTRLLLAGPQALAC